MRKLLLKILLGLVVVYTIVGIFVLPGIVKTQIEENASSALKRKVSVGAVSINPFAFSVNIENFTLHETIDKDNFVFIREIDVNVDPLDLITGTIDISLISLSSPRINVHKKADGTFNFADLLLLGDDANTTEPKEEPAKTELPNILIEKFVIQRGQIAFLDEAGAEPFNVKLKPINFTIRDFSTRNDHNNELSLYIEIDDGAFVKYNGKVNSLEPLRLEGSLQLHSGRLYTQWKYFKDTLGFIVADGALNAEMSYTADLSANPMQIHINQYKLNIDKLRLQDKASKEDMLTLPSLTLNGDVDVTKQQVNVEAFNIQGLTVKAVRDDQGVINWLSYLPKSAPSVESNATEEPSKWKVDVAHVGINTQAISFEEHYSVEPYIAGFESFDLNLKNIHMDDKALDINSYDLAIKNTYLNELKGFIAFEMPLFSLNGNAKLKQQEITLNTLMMQELNINALKDEKGKLNFEKYAPLADKTKPKTKEDDNSSAMKIQLEHMQITSNKITFMDKSVQEPFRTDIKSFEFNLADMKMQGDKIDVNQFTTKVAGLSLQPLSSKKNWAKFSSLKVKGSVSTPDKMDVSVHDVALNGLDIYALMDENGEINFDHIAPNATPTKKKVKAEPSSLNWKVENLNVNSAKITFEDKFNAEDAITKIDKMNFNMKNLSSKKGSWSTNKLSLRINKAGQFTVSSKLRQEPLKVYSKVRMKRLDLSKFQPYVEKKANADLNSGFLSFDIKADHSKKKTVVIANTEMNDFNISERREGKTFFAFSKLLIKNIDLTLNPDQMKIDHIDIYEPYARMKVDANKTTNLDGLMVVDANTSVQDSNATTVVAEGEKKKPFSVFIGKVNFKNGTGSFTDLSLPLPFGTDIHNLNGEMLALGTLEDIKTTTDIDGQVDEYGLMKIKGSLLSANPKKFTDMSVKFQNINMTNLSPYTGKFIGYKLKEGKMNVELDYKINNSQMKGGNRIILKKLTLGEEVESEDAISAPVGLAIALLKDSDGVIDLDVPVEGDVDNPEFAIGHVVWTAFKNMIVGVATAPFRFLGNMLGMDESELDNVAFEEGKSKLLPPEREKLDKLSTALIDKEMLTLQVAGSYDLKRDLLAMKTASLYKEGIAKLDDNSTDISKMDRDDFDDLLKELYVAHFKEEKLDKLEESIDKKDMDSDAKKLATRKVVTSALIDAQKVDVKDLISLANTRAQVIVDYLASKKIAPERLGVLEPFDIEISKEDNEYIPSKLELGAK